MSQSQPAITWVLNGCFSLAGYLPSTSPGRRQVSRRFSLTSPFQPAITWVLNGCFSLGRVSPVDQSRSPPGKWTPFSDVAVSTRYHRFDLGFQWLLFNWQGYSTVDQSRSPPGKSTSFSDVYPSQPYQRVALTWGLKGCYFTLQGILPPTWAAPPLSGGPLQKHNHASATRHGGGAAPPPSRRRFRLPGRAHTGRDCAYEVKGGLFLIVRCGVPLSRDQRRLRSDN